MATQYTQAISRDRIIRLVTAHRPALARLLAGTAVVMTLICLAGAVALWSGMGDRLAWIGSRAGEAARFLAFYAAPLFFAAPLWARHRLGAIERLSTTALMADIVVTTLAFARFVVGEALPFSGHMLFLSYTLLTVRGVRGYRWLALGLLIETTLFKLWLWRDPTSWGLGLALGLLAAAIVLLASRGDTFPDSPDTRQK